jgi:hypothetical protein
MARHVFMIATSPPPGESDDYGDWYEHHHMPDVLKVPGFVSAQRFLLAAGPHDDPAIPRYMTIFEIESDDRDGVLAELARRAGRGEMPLYAGSGAKTVLRLVGSAVTGKMVAET